jgi:hypothetical protein
LDRYGRLFVADHGNNRVQVFNGDGQFLEAFGRRGAGPGEFDKPCGLATGPGDRLYVAEHGNHRIQMFEVE